MDQEPRDPLPRWLWLLLGVAFLVGYVRLAMFHGLQPRGTDSQYYYAQARSLVLDGDLDLNNELRTLTPRPENVHLSRKKAAWDRPTATGLLPTKYPIGTPLLQAPALAVGHGVAVGLRALGLPAETDGYDTPYYLAWGLGNILWALLAIAAARALITAATGIAGGAAFGLAAAAFALGPAAYYAVGDPYMAHVHSTALVTVLMVMVLCPERVRGPAWLTSALSFGVTGGLAIIVRPTNALWVASATLLLVSRSGARLRTVAQVGLGGALGVLPQLVAWKVVYGSFLHYSYGEESFLWPLHVHANLFGIRAGLFAWNPLWLVAIVCALVSRRVPLLLRATVPVVVLLHSAWWCHWWGDTYGGRAYDSLFPLAAMGLGIAAVWLRAALRARPLWLRVQVAALLVAGTATAGWWTGVMFWRMEMRRPEARAQGIDMPFFAPPPRAN